MSVLWGCSSKCCPTKRPCASSGPVTPIAPVTPIEPITPRGPGTGTTGFDITKIQVGPDNVISWEDAKAIIQYANVRQVYQTHARTVYITLRDDTEYKTTEPGIDDVIHWVDTVGKREQIGILTQ